ncbi:MAG: hypothetical protein GY730_00490 [bacterium]|nr:hypothetical protein [bacterium]
MLINFRKTALMILVLLFMSAGLHAKISYDIEDFERKGLKGGFSLINLNEKNYGKLSMSPDFSLGPVAMGIDINFFMNLSGETELPSELQPLTLRHVSYDYENKHGFKWGRLRNVTLGYGLLMDSYDSGSRGSFEFNAGKAGFSGYTTIDSVRIDTMYTATSVKAVRGAYTHYESPFLGSPIVIGATYVSDSDGIDETVLGRTISRDKQNGYGIDIGLPIAGEFLTFYTEYVQLIDKGRGGSAGARGAFFKQFNYRLEYRKLGSRFVPGYFDNTYEDTTFDFDNQSTDKAVDGWFASCGSSFMDDRFMAGINYEKYDGRNTLVTAAFGWTRFQNTVGVINYVMPFTGKNNAVLNADVLYYTEGLFNYVIHYKRNYKGNDLFTESYGFSVRMDLNKMFPGLPFVINS